MSAITDTPAAGAAMPEAVARVVPAAPATEPASVPPADLVRLAQGFYFLFWGVLVSVVVGTQIMVMLWLRTFAEVFLWGGVLATVVGAWRLRQARFDPLAPATRDRWRRATGWLFSLALLLGYFCVLFSLWRLMPGNLYLQVNALLFVVCAMVFLVMLNRAVTAVAAVLGRRELLLESRLFVLGNIGLLVIPAVGAISYLVLMSRLHQTNLLVEYQVLLTRLSFGASIVLLLPLSLTLSVVWAAKDIAVRALLAAGEPGPAAAPPDPS